MSSPLDQFARKDALQAPFRIPTMPKLANFIKSFGLKEGVVKYDESVEAWRKDLERMFPIQDLQNIQSVITEKVTQVVSQVTTPTSPPVTGGGEELEDLRNAFEEHIAADVVHRKDTPVVGESDEQILESKTIGMERPRNARFLHHTQVNKIRQTEVFVILAEENMIIAGPMAIGGELTVYGYFASVDSTVP